MRHRCVLLAWTAHAAKDPQNKPVAICVTGLARAFHAVPRVHRSIWAHMVWPIIDEADVFFALDDISAGRAGVRSNQVSDATVAAEAQSLWRPVYDVALASRGLEESLAVCHGAIAARERFLRRNYTWVLRLRPDATYRTHERGLGPGHRRRRRRVFPRGRRGRGDEGGLRRRRLESHVASSGGRVFLRARVARAAC